MVSYLHDNDVDSMVTGPHTLQYYYTIDPTLSTVGGEYSPPVASPFLNDPGLNDAGVTDSAPPKKVNRSWIMILLILGILFAIFYLVGEV